MKKISLIILCLMLSCKKDKKPSVPEVDPPVTQKPPVVVKPPVDSGKIYNKASLGIVRSGLPWMNNGQFQSKVNEMLNAGARIIRTDLRESHDTWKVVEIARMVKSRNAKLLLNVMDVSSDFSGKRRYVNNALFKKTCGWNGITALSDLNHGAFRSRFGAQVKQLRDNNVSVHAFEIANEIDWVCFNGDVPLGRVANTQDEQRVANAYKSYFNEAYKIIKKYFPNSLILTAGMANIPDWWKRDSKVHGYNIIKWLGRDFISKVDGVAVHQYPRKASDLAVLLDQYKPFLNNRENIYITEWGFNKNLGGKRLGLMRSFMDAAKKYKHLNVKEVYYYAWDGDHNHFGLNGTGDTKFLREY